MTLTTALLVVAVGALIGLVGLGGFLLVPILVALEGASTRDAVMVAAVSFLCAGLLSLALWRRRAPGEAVTHAPFLLGTAPGAMLGAALAGVIVERALTLAIAVAFIVAAAIEWLGLPRGAAARPIRRTQAIGGGVLTGFASALTGTSGPMVAMPMLAWAGVPTRERIAIGQVAQVPIALGATITFAGVAVVPWTLAAWSSAALCIGMLASTQVARRIDVAGLRRLAALLMLGAAAALLMRG